MSNVSNYVFCQWIHTVGVFVVVVVIVVIVVVVVVVVVDVEILDPCFIKYILKTVKFHKFVPLQVLTTHKGSNFQVPFIVNLRTIGR
jgi:hypothetical protein